MIGQLETAAGAFAIRGVLLDVDGTLYRSGPVRRRMFAELAALPLRTGWRRARAVWRQISAYRAALEEVRCGWSGSAPLRDAQCRLAAERCGAPIDEVASIAAEWMHERPLRHLRRARRPGVDAFLRRCESTNAPVGVFSDYPVADKLEVLELRALITLELCATDDEIAAFKPDPAGLLHACRVWQLEPREVLYVGDRRDIDAVAAAAAGMACAIVTHGRGNTPNQTVCVRSFAELSARLF